MSHFCLVDHKILNLGIFPLLKLIYNRNYHYSTFLNNNRISPKNLYGIIPFYFNFAKKSYAILLLTNYPSTELTILSSMSKILTNKS